MPHDSNGRELKVSDLVMVPCRVKAVHLTENYCNVDLVTALTMYPAHEEFTALTLNSRQVILPSSAVPVSAPVPGEVPCPDCVRPAEIAKVAIKLEEEPPEKILSPAEFEALKEPHP